MASNIIGHIICHECLQKVGVSILGTVFMHSHPFNGEYCPLCSTTGKVIENTEEVSKRPKETPYGVYV